jgi:hypothetical protein
MKKLLLGAMMAALFMGNAEGRNVRDSLSSVRQSVTDTTKRSAKKVGDVRHNMTHRSDVLKKSRKKNAEDDVFTQNMGAHYQPTLRAINANLGGWINVLKISEKDDKYSLAKTDIKHFRQTLEAVYEFTTAVQKKKKNLERLSADAEGALNTFTKEKLNSFLNTTYGKDHLPYLTSLLAQINNALMTLVYPEEVVSIGGIGWTSEGGSDFNIESKEAKVFITSRSYKPESQISEDSQVKSVWKAFNDMLKAWEKQRKIIANTEKDVNTKRDREANIDDDEDVSSKKRQKVSKRSRSVETETEEMESSPKANRKSLRKSRSMNDVSDSTANRRPLRKSRSMSDLDD